MSDLTMLNTCFRAYDVRGRTDTMITTALAASIGAAFVRLLRRESAEQMITSVIAGDCRQSSPSLLHALQRGMEDEGAAVHSIGLAPTPALYYAVKYYEADGGIMVTGSHNPVSDNGFKITDSALAWHTDRINALYEEVVKVMGERTYHDGMFEQTMPALSPDDVYIQAYISCLLQKALRQGVDIFAEKKIAWDPGNGAMAAALPALLERIPGEHIVLNGTPDGMFPGHHPDPGNPENMQQLISCVLEQQCDAGFAFDGDGDRLGVIEPHGTQVKGDALSLYFAADSVHHSDRPQPVVVADVKTGRGFFDALRAMGAVPFMWKTGHSLVKEKMKDMNAIFGGEASGHLFFSEQYGFDDALFGALRFTDIAHHEKLRGETPSYLTLSGARTPEWRISISDNEKFVFVEALADIYRREKRAFIDIDGVRVDKKDAWYVVRASNTGPYVIIMAEADDDDILYQTVKELDADIRACGYDMDLIQRLHTTT